MKAIPSDQALRVFRYVLAVTALWTLMGAVPGYLDPAASFERFSGAPAESPIVLELYRGAWGQTLLFAIGYAVASFDPRRHLLVVVLGAVGKSLYAARILIGFSGNPPNSLALTAALGDLIFVALIAASVIATQPARVRLLEASPS